MKLTFNKKFFIWALALLGAELYYLVLSFVKVKHKDKLIWGIFAFAVAVEVMQYLGVATYLGFTRGSLGYILLGNHFSWADVVCYAIGCLILQFTSKNK